MICPYCHTKNDDKNDFCLECGKKLKIKDKKSQNTAIKILIVVIIILATIASLAIFNMAKKITELSSETITEKQTPTEDINSEDKSSPTPITTPKTTITPEPIVQERSLGDFPIQHLQIASVDPVWTGTPQNPVPFLNVNIKNTHNQAATAVQLRLEFYTGETAVTPYDTKYITLLGVANPGDSTLRGNVPGFKVIQDNIWYNAVIVSATYSE